MNIEQFNKQEPLILDLCTFKIPKLWLKVENSELDYMINESKPDGEKWEHTPEVTGEYVGFKNTSSFFVKIRLKTPINMGSLPGNHIDINVKNIEEIMVIKKVGKKNVLDDLNDYLKEKWEEEVPHETTDSL